MNIHRWGVCMLAAMLTMSLVSSRSWGQAATKKAKAPNKQAEVNPPYPKPTLSEVRYGPHERQVLDYWQAKSAIPTPLVFVIHGGGWMSGSKERVAKFVDVEKLLAAGISVVSINYRYVSQADISGGKPPVHTPLHDAARALQFVRSRAAEWNIDKDRIGAAGGSAGACSSLWLAFHNDLSDPQSKDPVARESTRLWCAAVQGAQTTLDPLQMREWTPNSNYGAHAFGISGSQGVSAFDQWLKERERIQPWIAEYSPYALAGSDDPGTYLYYSAPPAIGQTQKDPTHTANFGVKLQEKLVGVGVPCELVYPGAPNVKHADATEYLIETLQAKRP